MDRAAEYRDIIKRIIQEYADFIPRQGDVVTETIFDDEHGHYLLYYVGWDKQHYVHGGPIHIDLRGEKMWVQHDGTKDGIVDELLEAGIPKENIVLGFHFPQHRRYTEFAVE